MNPLTDYTFHEQRTTINTKLTQPAVEMRSQEISKSSVGIYPQESSLVNNKVKRGVATALMLVSGLVQAGVNTVDRPRIIKIESMEYNKPIQEKSFATKYVALDELVGTIPDGEEIQEKPFLNETVTGENSYRLSIIKTDYETYNKQKILVSTPIVIGTTEEVISAMSDNTDKQIIPFNTVDYPVEYGGKLPVRPENNHSILNNEREFVDISHKMKEVVIPVSYGGRLPVGRERA